MAANLSMTSSPVSRIKTLPPRPQTPSFSKNLYSDKFQKTKKFANGYRVLCFHSHNVKHNKHICFNAATTEFQTDSTEEPINGTKFASLSDIEKAKISLESSNIFSLATIATPKRPSCPCTAAEIFSIMRQEALQDSQEEPALASFLYSTIMAHQSLTDAISFLLGNKLGNQAFLDTQLMILFRKVFSACPKIESEMTADLLAVFTRDPACEKYSQPLLYFKGFQALQAHRVSHHLWGQGRKALALALQSRVSEVFHVDIHPAATLGQGLMLDHATGIVIGETAEVGNNVSILHHVTLGGTGAHMGDRHPKIGDGVLIGAGVTILGPIRVGIGAKIGAGSVVLNPIGDHETAVGVPARVLKLKKEVKKAQEEQPSLNMDQTSFINEINWSDYNI